MSFNRQRNAGQQRGGYGYQEMNQQPQMGAFNNPTNLLANLDPQAQVALASTLLNTLLQNQQTQAGAYGMQSAPAYQTYQPQFQPQYDYRDDQDRRGYRNEPPAKYQRFEGRADRRQDNRGRGRGGNRGGASNQKRDEPRRKDARGKGANNDNRDRKQQPGKKTQDLPKKTPVKKSDNKPKPTEAKAETDKKVEPAETQEEPASTVADVTEAVETDAAEEAENVAEATEKSAEEVEKMESEEKEEEVKEKPEEVKKEKEPKADKAMNSEEKKKAERAVDTTPYAGLPESYLFCYVCEKQTWDGPSFIRHIRGNKHKNLLGKLEKVYEATIQSLRLMSQLDEQRRTLDIDSKFSFGRQNFRPRKTKCSMCEMSFYGSILSHRASQAHKTLKNFIHPKCTHCDLEFSSKVEFDEHRLTAAHMKKVLEDSPEDAPAKRFRAVDGIMEQLEFKPAVKPLHVEGASEPTPAVTEEDEYDTNVVGAYDVYTPTAQTEVSVRTVYFCERCSKFIDRNEKEKQAHLKSDEHLKAVAEKTKEENDPEEVPKEEEEEMETTAEADEIVEHEEDAGEEAAPETGAEGANDVAEGDESTGEEAEEVEENAETAEPEEE